MFHMGWFLGAGFGVYGWGDQWAGNAGRDVANPQLFIDMATSLERAGFDYMMLEDASYLHESKDGSHTLQVDKGGIRLDPMTLVPLLAAATSKVGIIATASTSFYPPYILARLMASLDHVTHGRVGVNLVTSSPDAAAQNFGLDAHYEHDLRYEMADEWVECCKALWDTWDKDALVLDEDGMFADATKIHHANFEGRWYKARGPLNTPPGPQGRPVICQAGGSNAGMDFGARHADTIIASLAENPGLDSMKAYRQEMNQRLLKFGRKPSDAKLLFLAHPVMADTDEQAQEKYRQMGDAVAANVEQQLAGLSSYSGLDWTKFDLDAPVPDVSAGMNGHQSLVLQFVEFAQGKTLRQALAERARHVGSVPIVGSPATCAAQMGEIMEEVGGDGFLIRAQPTRKNMTEICDGLAPALRRRGLIRSAYSYDTLRENLLEF
jgi:FMN-dependent oxidoreductase (nitrilotriacetate monooxygenase family)